MALYRTSTFVLLVIFSCALASYAAVSQGHHRGGWHPIKDVNAPEIQELAKFALTEHNKVQGTTLHFAKVLSGEQHHDVSGSTYKLNLEAKDADGKFGTYKATVEYKPKEDFRKLLSFFISSEATIRGGWHPIKDVDTLEIQELAKFALTEHNKVRGKTLHFTKVLSGEQHHDVSGVLTYKLNLEANDASGKLEKYKAVVEDKPLEDFRKLLSFIPSEVTIPGGWNPIKNVKAPEVQEVAKFALREYNKDDDATLHFVKVLSGEMQVVAGFKYMMILEADDANEKSRRYEAIVFDPTGRHLSKKLISFLPV